MVPRIARIILYGGSAGIVNALAWAHAQYIGEYPFTDTARFAWTWVYIGVIWLIVYSAGLPEHDERNASVRASIIAAGFAPTFFGLVQAVAGSALIPRFVIAGSVAPLFLLFVLCGLIDRRTRSAVAERDAVLAVIDTEDERQELRNDIRSAVLQRAMLKAVMTSAQVEAAGGLAASIQQRGANVVVVDRAALNNEKLVAEASALHQRGLRVRSLVDFYEEWIGKVPLHELELSVLMFDIAEVHEPAYRRMARLVDLVVGIVGMLAMAVVVPIVVVGNLVANRGPLFYRQPRVGRDGATFQILKFRSMTSAHTTSEWTAVDDARVTPFGRALRLSHLDELPQMWNILRGDLSIVGPRPEQPRYVDELTEKIPFYQLRHLVRPGLTGWAQVNYPYGANEQDALEKLQYEFWYLRHQGIWLDLSIIAKTLRHVVGLRGR